MQSEEYKKARSTFLSGLAIAAVGLLLASYLYLATGGGSMTSLILIGLGIGRALMGLSKMSGAKDEDHLIDGAPAMADNETQDDSVAGQ